MKFTQTTTKTDWITLQKHHLANSRDVKKRKTVMIASSGVIVFCMLILYNVYLKESLGFADNSHLLFNITIPAFMTVFCTYFFFNLNSMLLKKLIKKYDRGEYPGFSQKCTFEFENETMSIDGEKSKSKAGWDIVYKVERNESSLFIYFNPSSAIIISKKSLEKPDDFEKAADFLGKRFKITYCRN